MPHMQTSPFTVNGLEDGRADGARDAIRIGMCPPLEPEGTDPTKDWSVRYRQGYGEAFALGRRHRCTARCRRVA